MVTEAITTMVIIVVTTAAIMVTTVATIIITGIITAAITTRIARITAATITHGRITTIAGRVSGFTTASEASRHDYEGAPQRHICRLGSFRLTRSLPERQKPAAGP